jgi:WXG100 family type VII secretion target
MTSMHVDIGRLQQKIAKLEGTVQDLAQHEAKVAQIAQELQPSWSGDAGGAVQKALADYVEAVADLGREQTTIVDKVKSATAQYQVTDAAGAGSLADAMRI